MKKRTIVYIVNNSYLNLFKTSLFSLLYHNKNIDFPIIIFYDNSLVLKQLKQITNHFIQVKFIFKKLFLKPYKNIHFHNNNRKWGLTPGARFDIFKLCGYDELLYLDCDTLIVNNIMSIFDLKGDFIACRLSPATAHKYSSQNGFNAGILLIRKKYLTNAIFNKLVNFSLLNKNLSGNQIILNFFFSQVVTLVDQNFNITTDLLTLDNLKTGKIFHFIGDKKPSEKVLRNSFNEYVTSNVGLGILAKLFLLYKNYEKKAYCFYNKLT